MNEAAQAGCMKSRHPQSLLPGILALPACTTMGPASGKLLLLILAMFVYIMSGTSLKQDDIPVAFTNNYTDEDNRSSVESFTHPLKDVTSSNPIMEHTWEEEASETTLTFVSQTDNSHINTDDVITTAYKSYHKAREDDEKTGWSKIFDWVQFGVTTAGLIANILTFITLHINGRGFSRTTLLLFRHQAFTDAVVCLIASVVILQPFMWLTGLYYLDQLVCHIWHGQALYWGFVTVSTYNLVLIAYERYISVCKPFSYSNLESMPRSKIFWYLSFLYLFTLFITHGTYIQTRLENNECVNAYAFNGKIMEHYFTFFVIFTYITTYFLPALIMATLYGLVAYTLRMRGRDTRLTQSRLVDRASSDLTKTAVAVTVIFVISIGYDLHYYLLGHTGAVVYHLNTPIQKVGVFLSNVNSTCNPLVYALLMPLYRRSMGKTFSCQREGRQKTFVMSALSNSIEMTHGGSVTTISSFQP